MKTIPLAVIPLLLFGGSRLSADRIILRDLKIISDRTVTAFDEDGVRLDDGKVLTWDQIEKGKVAADRQAEFDRMLEELGTNLYRIRQRLTTGDYEGILPHAEVLYPRYAGRTSETAYMVFQALMWSRLSVGRRAPALEPYLKCYGYMRRQRTTNVPLPGRRRLKLDPATGITAEIPPVWFDRDEAKKALPDVYQAIRALPSPRPEGVLIYYSTMALAAGEVDTAIAFLGHVRGAQKEIRELRDIALAQREVLAGEPGATIARLERTYADFEPSNQPLALYWLGLAKIAADTKQGRLDAVLLLLRIPAIHGTRYPDLAGAALYHAMKTLEQLNDARGSIAVRQELLDRFGQTYHAGMIE